jgi:hypothetical protein
MKCSTKGLLVIVLIVMSLVALPAAFAGTKTHHSNNPDPGKPDFEDPCINIVEGCVTATGYRTIVLDDSTVIKTPLNWVLPEVDEKIWVKYWVNPDGEKVACEMHFIEYCGD